MLGGPDRDPPGQLRDLIGQGVQDDGMAAPRAAHDDQLGIGQRDDGGQHAADSPGQGAPGGGRLSLRTAGRREEAGHVDRGGPGLAQAQLAEDLDERPGLAAGAGGDEVGHLAREPGVAAADLAVADDGAAEALAEEQVGEVGQRGVGPAGLGPGGPVDVVVDGDRAVDQRGEDLDRVELAEQERRVGQLDEPAADPVHGIGGADHGQARGRVRGAADRLGDGGAQGGYDVLGPGGPGDGLGGTGHGVAVGAQALGHDALGRDADRQGQAEVAGQRVVRADPAAPAAAGGPLAGVDHQPGLGQPAHALADGGLGDPGLGGQLGPGQPAMAHEGAQHVLVGQRAQQLQRGLGGIHSPILVRSLA